MLLVMEGRLFGGRKRGRESGGVGGRKPTGQDKGCRNRGQASCKRRLPSPMHCAIALWLKIASDDELRTRGRKTPGKQTHAAEGGTFPGGQRGEGGWGGGSHLVIGMQGGGGHWTARGIDSWTSGSNLAIGNVGHRTMTLFDGYM